MNNWLPSNFTFSKGNPVSVYTMETSLNTMLSFAFDNVNVQYNIYPYSTYGANDADVMFITKGIKNHNHLLGSMLYRMGRKQLDFDVNELYGKIVLKLSNYKSADKDKILLIIHTLLIQNVNIFLKNKTPGLYKYLMLYYKSIYNSRSSWEMQQLYEPIFINNNWNSYLIGMLNMNIINYNQHNSVNKLNDINSEYKAIATQLNIEQIIEITCNWYELLNDDVSEENNYNNIMTELEEIQKYFEKLRFFVFNEFDSETITASVYKQKKTLSSSKITQTKYIYQNTSLNIIQLHLNKQIVKSNIFNIFETKRIITRYTNKYIIPNGIKIGRKILNYLQYRDNEPENRINYQTDGTLNRRILYRHRLGELDLYHKNIILKHKHKTVYLTVDASESMAGNKKWDKLQTFVVSLIYAIDRLKSLNIKVMYRMTVINKNKKTNIDPIILTAYDMNSNWSDVYNIIPYLKPNGGSPEGILLSQLDVTDSIIINISDGQPQYFNHDINYEGSEAIEHTKNVVNTLKQTNRLISFYVGNKEDEYKTHEYIYGREMSMNVNEDIDKIGLMINKILFEI